MLSNEPLLQQEDPVETSKEMPVATPHLPIDPENPPKRGKDYL